MYKQAYFTLVNPVDPILNNKYEECEHFQPHHDAKNFVNGCAICFDTIPKEYIKKVIHTEGQGR